MKPIFSLATMAAYTFCAFTPTWARDGHSGEDNSHLVVAAASACTELPSAFASARSGGAFTVRDGATASLICALPAEELAHSLDDHAPVALDVAYLDSDGPGAALVTVELVRTVLAADPDGYSDTGVCAWSSAAAGSLVGTVARLACPGAIVEGAFHHLRVALTSAPGSAASFIGVVARR